MEQTLRILMLEDEPADAALIERELRKAQLTYTAKRVETQQDFAQALQTFAPHVIMSDYTLPSFDGFSALAMVRIACPKAPFIFVSGTIGEELAIEALKNGATDYVLKHRLSKLGPVVRRALQIVEDRQARQQAERFKEEMLDILSHELHTPLTVIQEEISQMADGMLGPVNQEQAECLKAVKASFSRLNRLSEKALLATQVMTRKLEYNTQTVSLAPILQQLRESCGAMAEASGITLRVDECASSVSSLGDGKLMTAALRELVENAIQATPKGGNVVLSCSPISGGIAFSVRDTGCGINAEALPTLFERFRWVGNVNDRKTGGLGLGLFIAKSIIEAHGGKISLESTVGEGTQISVFLPRRQRQVLIVDNTATDAELLQREVVKHTTCETILAASGEEALAKVQQCKPDLVLLDIQMPGIDGIETLKRLKAIAPRLPVAMVTGVWREVEAQKTLALGAYDYVTKPVDVEYLKRVLLVQLLESFKGEELTN